MILPLIFFSGTSGNGGVKGLLSGVVKLLVFSFSFFAISMFSLCCFAFICTTQTASDLTTVLHSTHVSWPDSLYVNCLLRKKPCTKNYLLKEKVLLEKKGYFASGESIFFTSFRPFLWSFISFLSCSCLTIFLAFLNVADMFAVWNFNSEQLN